MSENTQVLLGEVAEVTVGYVGPMASEYVDQGVPFLRSLNVRPHRIDLTDVRYVSPSFHVKLQKSALRPGDVVTVRTGKPGQTAVVPHWLGEANCSDLVITRPGPRLDARWLSYYLNWITETHIAGQLVGAVQQHFNVQAAQSLRLDLPSLPAQRAVAEVLGALDDKIAANERTISAADALAGALTDSSLSGEVVRLDEIATLTMGSSPPGSSYNESRAGLPFFQGVRDFGVRFPSLRVWTDKPVRVAAPGDTLLSVRAPVGRTNLADREVCIGRGLAALRAKDGRALTLFHQVRAAHATWAPYQAEGTVFGAISRSQLEGIELPALEVGRAGELESQLTEIERLIACAIRESAQLARTRDELLPLLMSGKVRVKDVQDALEGTTHVQ